MVRLAAAMSAPCQLQNFIIWEAPFLLLEGPLSKNPCILFEKSGWKGERRGTRQKGYFVDIFFIFCDEIVLTFKKSITLT